MQKESKVVKRALSAKENEGQMPGPKDRQAESLRTSTFLCSEGSPKILKKRKIMVGARICEPVVIPEEFAEAAVNLFHVGNCGTQTRLLNQAKCEI